MVEGDSQDTVLRDTVVAPSSAVQGPSAGEISMSVEDSSGGVGADERAEGKNDTGNETIDNDVEGDDGKADGSGPDGSVEGDGADDADDGMTKSMRKKVARRLRRDEAYKKNKAARRLKEKAKKAAIRRAHMEAVMEAKREGRDPPAAPYKPRPPRHIDASNLSDQRIVIDLDFSDKMVEKDLKKAVKQVERCYAANRKSKAPLKMYVTGIDDTTTTTMDKLVPHRVGWSQVVQEKQGYMELFNEERENLVYLTADSDNVIHELDSKKVYIIGGIVDHNSHKNLCLDRAMDQGIAHGQLPIGEYVKLASRKVLTINHVMEILIAYEEHKDWKKAFLDVIPQRKF